MSKEIYAELTKPFPAEAMTVDNSRGFKLTSIKAQYVRERLNEVMGVDGWETTSTIVNQDDNGVAVSLAMTLHFGNKKITRTAFGGAKAKGKGQTFGDLYKSAETDALSKAASNFGVGNDVFKGLVDAKTLGKKTTTKSSGKSEKSSFPRSTQSKNTTTEEVGNDI